MHRLGIILILILLVTGAGPASAGRWSWGSRDDIEGSGDIVTIERDVRGFSRIKIDCAFDLEITIGDWKPMELVFDDNLLEYVETEVTGRTLRLDCSEDLDFDESCLIRIQMPELTEVTIDGAGDVSIKNFQGDSFEYNLNGAGNLDIAGEAKELAINLNGAGHIDARRLQATEVDVDLAGAGSVDVYAEESFRGSVSGVGNITYYGDPEHVRERVSGIGSIDRD